MDGTVTFKVGDKVLADDGAPHSYVGTIKEIDGEYYGVWCTEDRRIYWFFKEHLSKVLTNGF